MRVLFFMFIFWEFSVSIIVLIVSFRVLIFYLVCVESGELIVCLGVYFYLIGWFGIFVIIGWVVFNCSFEIRVFSYLEKL